MKSVILFLLCTFCGWANSTVVLMYHRVNDRFPPGPTVISPDNFKEHIKAIKQSGYRTMTISELVKYLDSGKALPRKSVVITFDDGWVEMAEVAQFLKTADTKAVFYAISGALGSPEYLTRHQLHAIGVDFEVGAHSVSHFVDHSHDLPSIPLSSMVGEAIISKNVISRVVGKPVIHYAWPYGHFSDAAVDNVTQEDYASTVTVDRCSFPTTSKKIPRVNIDGRLSTTELLKILETGCQ